MDEHLITQRLHGHQEKRDPMLKFIRMKISRNRGTRYVLAIPIWRNGNRKTTYIGTYDDLEAAINARRLALTKIQNSTKISINSQRNKS